MVATVSQSTTSSSKIKPVTAVVSQNVEIQWVEIHYKKAGSDKIHRDVVDMEETAEGNEIFNLWMAQKTNS